MTNLTNKLFLPVLLLLLSISPVSAHNDTFFNSPHKLELKPASFSAGGIQLAKSYWLGGAEIDLNFKGDDDDTICQAKGYITGACKGNETPIKYCGAGNKYHLCGCDISVYRYSIQTCGDGSSPDGNTCGDYSSGCVCDGAFVWNSDSNSCDFYCSSNYDCPGQVCRTSNGDCVDCVYDSDCGSGQSCTNNKCETADLCANVNCTGGQMCNASTGECECPSGQVLSDGRCEQANCANGGSSCSTGVCDMNSGQCVECTSDSHCSGNKECINNTCQVIDTCKNVTCTGGKTCVDGTCACPAGKIDNNGVCEGPDCSNGGVTCSDDQTCNTTTKMCETAILTHPCRIGDIFYTNKTCSSVYIPAENPPSMPPPPGWMPITPVGIVVDPENRLLVSLYEEEGTIAAAYADNMEAYNNFVGVGNEVNPDVSERGFENTLEIWYSQYGMPGNRGEMCRASSTSGPGLGLEGKWYIPGGAELKKLFAKNVDGDTLDKINATLSLLSKNIRTATIGSPMWTSDEGTDPGTMWVYEPHYDGLASLRLKDDTGITFRCMARYQCPENETCGSITPNNAYVSGYTPSCPAPYFKETFYWNNAYTRCVNDNLEGETPTPGLPPCEPWENTGWYKVTSSFDQNTCAARGAAVQDCKYSNGATAQFCDLSTDCGIGGNYNSYYDYRYCPNGAECVYRDCRYGVTVAFEIPQQITNKQCFACWQYTNDGCGSENHYIRCK